MEKPNRNEQHETILQTRVEAARLAVRGVGIQIKQDHPAFKSRELRLVAFTHAYGGRATPIVAVLIEKDLIKEVVLPDGSIFVTHTIEDMGPNEIAAAFTTLSFLAVDAD